jgi:hypothetical protein
VTWFGCRSVCRFANERHLQVSPGSNAGLTLLLCCKLFRDSELGSVADEATCGANANNHHHQIRNEFAALREMVGAGEGPSDGGNSSSACASASASDVFSSSSLPRSFSYGTDDGLETGRQSLLDSRANSTNSLLVSRGGSGMQLLCALPFNIF